MSTSGVISTWLNSNAHSDGAGGGVKRIWATSLLCCYHRGIQLTCGPLFLSAPTGSCSGQFICLQISDRAWEHAHCCCALTQFYHHGNHTQRLIQFVISFRDANTLILLETRNFCKFATCSGFILYERVYALYALNIFWSRDKIIYRMTIKFTWKIWPNLNWNITLCCAIDHKWCYQLFIS